MKFATLLRAALAAIVGLLALASLGADKPNPADLIIHNANVVTLSSTAPFATAVAIRQDRIIAVGRDYDMEDLQGPLTRMIDAQGRTLLPGLYDNHVQSYDASISELAGPQPALNSIPQAQEYIRQQVAKKPAGSWIIVDRVYPTRVEDGRLPTKAELDAAAPHNPVYWNCGLIGVANSMALQVSSITNSTRNPPGGELVRDVRTLKPTGLLRNAAGLLRLPPAQPLTRLQRREALKSLYQLYNEQGITSIGEGRASKEAIDLFRELGQDGQLSVRINCARVLTLGASLEESIANLDALTNFNQGGSFYGPTGAGDDWVRMGPLRAIVDGDVSTATAYLRAPWGIGPTYQIKLPAYTGVRYTDPEILPDVYVEAAQRGWQLSAHTAGDAAMDSILNCYQYVQFQTNLTQRRLLITHANFQAAQNWERCQALGVGAEIQPGVLYTDGFSLMRTLGEKRMRWFMPLKTWFDKGLVIGAGSDHVSKLNSLDAANPWNPWLGMWITLTRATQQSTVIHPEECLTREQALRMYTLNNAWLNFEDKKKGSLEAGKLADLILIDRDILKCPVGDVRDTKVLLTMVGGKVVWEARPAVDLTTLQSPPAEAKIEEKPEALPVIVKSEAAPVAEPVEVPVALDKPEVAPAAEPAEAPLELEKPDAPPVAEKTAVPPVVETTVAAPASEKPEAPAAVEKTEAPPASEKADAAPTVEKADAPPAVQKPEAPPVAEKTDSPTTTGDWSRLATTSSR